MRHFQVRGFIVGMGIGVAGALVLRALVRLPFWACLAIVLVGLLINGWLAAWEDDQPDGFYNPNTNERNADDR